MKQGNRNKNKTMCYFEQQRYRCHDWKWGNFRQHCQREYRMGETCGMKLVYDTKNVAENCPMCEKIERKERRLAKAKADYARWKDDPNRQASKEKAYEDIVALIAEIERLKRERQARYVQVGNPRRG